MPSQEGLNEEDGWIRRVECMYKDSWDTITLKYQQN